MTPSDKTFKDFVSHILSFEGGLSKDERDTAVSCAPFKGAYHTNKGVTYCTFKSLAESLGIPNTYDRFIKMTDDDTAKFIYHFYKESHGDLMPPSIGLSVTEASWGSGVSRAMKNLQQALFNLGKLSSSDVDGGWGSDTQNAVKSVSEPILYSAFWKERQRFIDSLTAQPKYAMYKKGWQRRIDSFLSNINFPNIIKTTGQQVTSAITTAKKNPYKTIAILTIIGVGILIFNGKTKYFKIK